MWRFFDIQSLVLSACRSSFGRGNSTFLEAGAVELIECGTSFDIQSLVLSASLDIQLLVLSNYRMHPPGAFFSLDIFHDFKFSLGWFEEPEKSHIGAGESSRTQLSAASFQLGLGVTCFCFV